MNNKFWIKLSNIIGIVAIILLIYWIFFFAVIEIFGLKVLQKYIQTDTFTLSIMGILAIILGSLMINIMFNLTRIAEKSNGETSRKSIKNPKKWMIAFILSFPFIFALLYGGNYLRSEKNKNTLFASVKSVVENNGSASDSLVNYSFTKEWMNKAMNILDIYSKIDRRFGIATIIVADTIDNIHVFLEFDVNNSVDTILPKKNYILETTSVERDYLNDIFANKKEYVKYGYHYYGYKLFYPYSKNGKTIVLVVDEIK